MTSTKFKLKNEGFTLIELLVVIAIIGILSSIVLASLNTARSRGQEAAIKSNLRSMISQAELTYDTPGNYSTACAGVAKMLAAINNSGATSACFSYNSGLTDVYLRWGASAKKSDGTKNWSVDSTGVVTWDATNTGTTMTWDAANTACASAGGSLPSAEELKSLYDAYGAAPTGFTVAGYWSNTTVPSNSSEAYNVNMGDGNLYNLTKAGAKNVRCVR